MNMIPKKSLKPFFISGILWHELSSIVTIENMNKFQEVLTKNITLNKYGFSIKEHTFIFICIRPSNKIHKEEIKYKRKKKELYMQYKLDYEQIIKSTPEQAIKLMAELFLSTIDNYKTLKMPDFDVKNFKKDIKALFIKESWIEKDKKSGEKVENKPMAV